MEGQRWQKKMLKAREGAAKRLKESYRRRKVVRIEGELDAEQEDVEGQVEAVGAMTRWLRRRCRRRGRERRELISRMTREAKEAERRTENAGGG